MNFEYYIAKKITFLSKRTFSKAIVRISVAAIALSVAVMMVSISIVKGFQSEIKNKLIGFASHIQITRTNINYTFESRPIEFSPDVYNQIKKFGQVKNIHVFGNKPGIITSDKELEGVILKGVSSDFNWSNLEKILVSGTLPNYSDSLTSNDILISETLAKKLKLKTADQTIVYFVQQPPRIRKFRISGIYKTGIDELDKVFAICDIRHIRKLNNWSDNQIGGYEVFLNDISQLEYTNDLIRAAVGYDQDTKTIDQIYPQIFDWLGLLDLNVRIILILMLIVSIVNMITALLVIIIEKTNMIGLLKAMGATNINVSKIFVYSASFLILSGIILGNVIGIGFIFLQSHFEIIKLPPESYYVDHVPVSFFWGRFLLLNLVTFLICSLIMIIPSMFVSRISPLKAIRFD